MAVWQPIIRQYPPAFVSQCENAKKWAAEFVQEQLELAMFEGDVDRRKKAKRIVKKLSDFSGNRGHDRHVHFEECEEMGLKLRLIEDDQDLQDLILTTHHCYMHSLGNTAAIKIIESSSGTTVVKNVEIAQVRRG